MTFQQSDDMITSINNIDCSHRWLFIMVDDLLSAMDEGGTEGIGPYNI